jgi:hypothetical protein
LSAVYLPLLIEYLFNLDHLAQQQSGVSQCKFCFWHTPAAEWHPLKPIDFGSHVFPKRWRRSKVAVAKHPSSLWLCEMLYEPLQFICCALLSSLSIYYSDVTITALPFPSQSFALMWLVHRTVCICTQYPFDQYPKFSIYSKRSQSNFP